MLEIDGRFESIGARPARAFFTALDPARLAHGYLFSGPVGVGKATFARRLAQSLLCETPKATLLGYCDRCPGCSLVRAGTHPDFVATSGTMKIGTESGSALHDDEISARDLVRELALHGYRSRYRVVLLADVAFATHEAANALLKFFEEPPTGVIVVLTTARPGSLLPTIRSRFVTIEFPPLSANEVEAILRSDGVEAAVARQASAVALGSVTRARALVGGDGENVREAAFAWFADAVCGRVPRNDFLKLDDRGLSGAQKRENVAELLEVARVAARDWIALGCGDDVPLLAADQRARLSALPKREPKALVALLGTLAELERLAASNVSAGLVADYLRVQLAPPLPSGGGHQRP